MNDLPLMPPGSHLALRGRHLRSTSDSITRKHRTDDLLENLSPRVAVEAFQNPSGPLKTDMDNASPAERSFALRAAVASKKIQEWVDELSAWQWPAGGGSTGFEMLASKRRKISRSEGSLLNPTTDDDSIQKLYMGSLLVTDVSHYQQRVDEICRDMEGLNIEEIKSHVLHNHIMPMSRPGTPVTESSRSAMSLSSYVRMNDLTALITAITVFALRLLSKLNRLMTMWSARLLVLQKTQSFLDSLDDAEAALQSGWNTLSRGSKAESKVVGGNSDDELTTLSWEEFNVMKPVVGKMVSETGHELDSMLDVLEGYPDTLPEQWIDRMDSLGENYAEWVAVCERKIREAEWAALVRERYRSQLLANDDIKPESSDKPGARIVESVVPEINTGVPPSTQSSSTPTESQPVERGAPVIKIHSADDHLETDGAVDTRRSREGREDRLVSQDGSEVTIRGEPRQSLGKWFDGSSAEDDEGPWELVEAESESEPELPPLPRPRRDSNISTSTVLHGQPSGFEDLPSDPPDHGTPELPRLCETAVQEDSAEDASPPSSPPQSAFRSSARSLSVSFLDMPTVREVPDESTPPLTPAVDSSLVMGPVMDADVSKDLESPSKMSVTGADDQLQQQISQILESVPAKFRLTSEPQAINLNPPDFVLPTPRSTKQDPYPRAQRSLSSLSVASMSSSRAGTPSFMLAPAARSRSRQQRGNSDIKLYHLSRSNGEAPIKLFIRCVGEHGERVMVRVGGGWADLGEYLKEYASHHSRRSGSGKVGKVEIKDLPATARMPTVGSSPPSRPGSSQSGSPLTPLTVRKTRKSMSRALFDDNNSAAGSLARVPIPNTPLATVPKPDTPSSGESSRSRSSSHLSWAEEDSSLGMAGPRAKNVEISDDSKAWIESVKEKVRLASGERIPNNVNTPVSTNRGKTPDPASEGKFGDMGKVGGTKRLFRKQV